MYGDVGVIALVGKELGGTSSSIGGIIIYKFYEGQGVRPVVLLIVAVDSEILFQGLVNVFSLSAAFRVVSGGEVELHVKSLPESLEKG